MPKKGQTIVSPFYPVRFYQEDVIPKKTDCDPVFAISSLFPSRPLRRLVCACVCKTKKTKKRQNHALKTKPSHAFPSQQRLTTSISKENNEHTNG